MINLEQLLMFCDRSSVEFLYELDRLAHHHHYHLQMDLWGQNFEKIIKDD